MLFLDARCENALLHDLEVSRDQIIVLRYEIKFFFQGAQ